MISLKSGVKLNGLQPEMLLGLLIISQCYKEFGYDLVVTSVSDGVHRHDSLHNFGNAIDFRVRSVGKSDIVGLVSSIRRCLGGDFDVVLEADHLHVEFQPKGV